MTDDDNKLVEAPNASQISQFYDSDRLKEMAKMAEAFFKSGCFGQDVKNGYQALVIMQAGFEMGIPPMEAMGSFYIVNGKLSIYGMAMSKRLKQKGWSIQYEDKADSCTATITKGDQKYSYEATADAIKKLGSQAFLKAPKEKMRWHALSRLIRFDVPEVMDAGVSYLAEEVEDLPPMDTPNVKVVEDFDVEHALAQINKCNTKEELIAFSDTFTKYDISEDVATVIGTAILEKTKTFSAPEEPKEEPKADQETGEILEPEPKKEAKEEIPKDLDGHTAHSLLKAVRGSNFQDPRTESELRGMMDELDHYWKKEIITSDEHKECHGKVSVKLDILLRSKQDKS